MDAPESPLPAGLTAPTDPRYLLVARHVLGIEGGWSANSADRGGDTQCGVSLQWLEGAGIDLNGDGLVNSLDIRTVTPEVACALFYRPFWLNPGFDTLPRPIDAAMFDQALNCGVAGATRILQDALNQCRGAHVAVDGKFGPNTKWAVAHVMTAGGPLLEHLREAAAGHYRAIVHLDPTQQRFLNGWLARAARLGDV